jgi:hypothetical protein
MQNIERRVAALEAEMVPDNRSFKVLIVQDGESKADALARAGYPPDAADVRYVVLVSFTDALL